MSYDAIASLHQVSGTTPGPDTWRHHVQSPHRRDGRAALIAHVGAWPVEETVAMLMAGGGACVLGALRARLSRPSRRARRDRSH